MNARKRIAILTPCRPGTMGGVERFTMMLASVLEDCGHAVELLTAEPWSRMPGPLDGVGLREVWLALKVGRLYAAKSGNFDAALGNGLFGWWPRARRGLTVHHGIYAAYADCNRSGMGSREYITKRHGLALFEILNDQGRKPVAVSRTVAEQVSHYHRRVVETTILNAVDLTHFRPAATPKSSLRTALGLPQDKLLLLFVGRQEYRKGMDVVLELANRLPANAHLVAATDRSWNHPSVTSWVNVDYETLPLLYNACDAFVLPSRYEGCSYAVIEAAACGLPIVTTPTGHSALIAEHCPGSRNLLEVPVSLQHFRDAVSRVCALSDRDRRELGMELRGFAEQFHGIARFREAYMEAIETAEEVRSRAQHVRMIPA